MDLHGYYDSASNQINYSPWKNVGLKNNFILVWPDGPGDSPNAYGSWNCSRTDGPLGKCFSEIFSFLPILKRSSSGPLCLENFQKNTDFSISLKNCIFFRILEDTVQWWRALLFSYIWWPAVLSRDKKKHFLKNETFLSPDYPLHTYSLSNTVTLLPIHL